MVVAAENDKLEAKSITALRKYPCRTVLALNDAATEFHTYELRFHHEELFEPSVDALVDGIRSSAARRLREDCAGD